MKDNSTAQLGRCPLCNGECDLYSAQENCLIMCEECGLRSRTFAPDAQAEAIAAWNTRIPVSQDAEQLVERLRRGTLVSDNGRGVSEHRSTALEREAADLIEALTRVQPSTGLDTVDRA